MVPSQRYCTSCGAAYQARDAFCFACGQALQVTTASQHYPLAGSATSTSTGFLAPNLLLKQRYRILGTVGKGGFGAVYQAEDVQLGNRLLAVKEMSQRSLNPQEIAEAAENFKREAHILAALKHPNLPSIYEQFSEAGRWYLVMDFIEGETLEEHLKQDPQGHLSVEDTLQIGIQRCTVLGYLHSRQPPIIFRDLKPANIMRTSEGHLYLIDFGIARHFKPGQKRDTIAFGSPGYAAPEQYGKAQTTPRSDIYSLGATLHHLLTGVDPSDTPFQFAPLQLHGQPTPAGLKLLLMHMLDMHESNRPASMMAVQQELQRLSTQLPVGQVTLPPPGTQPAAPGSSPLQQVQPTPAGAPQQQSPPKVAGSLYLQAKRFQEALVAFEQALQLDATDAMVYHGKGLALSELKRYQEALVAFEQALQFEPKNSMACNNKGSALGRLGRDQEALAAYDRAIQLDPKYSMAFNNKGDTLVRLGRYEEALAAYDRAIQLDPTFSMAFNNKGFALGRLGREKEALAAYDRAIQLDPKYSMAFNNKGVALERLGRYKEALALYKMAENLDPSSRVAKSNKKKLEKLLHSPSRPVALFPRASHPPVQAQQLSGHVRSNGGAGCLMLLSLLSLLILMVGGILLLVFLKASISPPAINTHAVPSTIGTSQTSGFCQSHKCIQIVPHGKGHILECRDGTYSHSGGRGGACSGHGGELHP